MRNKTLLATFFLLLSCLTGFGHSSYQGLTPGQSTQAEVERVLGPPVNRLSDTLVEYGPQPETQKIYVQYRDGATVVERIEVLLPAPRPRAEVMQALNLPQQPTATRANKQERLEEFFGQPASVVLTYDAAESASGVIRIGYYSWELFEAATRAFADAAGKTATSDDAEARSKPTPERPQTDAPATASTPQAPAPGSTPPTSAQRLPPAPASSQNPSAGSGLTGKWTLHATCGNEVKKHEMYLDQGADGTFAGTFAGLWDPSSPDREGGTIDKGVQQGDAVQFALHPKGWTSFYQAEGRVVRDGPLDLRIEGQLSHYGTSCNYTMARATASTPQAPVTASTPPTSAQRLPLPLEGKTALPLRVLARPLANIYKEKDESKGLVEENVPVFQPYYVYTRPAEPASGAHGVGWYEVGSDTRGTVLGWMKAQDVFEWKQTMILVFTHPGERHPVLLFEQLDVLHQLVKAPDATRKAEAEKLYATLNTGQKPPATFPVRSMEPKKAIDLAKQFYLLPILDFQEISLELWEGRLLKLAAATAAGPDARQASDIRHNDAYRGEALEGATQVPSDKLKALELDLVFVMDMTNSMQPYIDATLDAMEDISRQVAQGADATLHQSVHFGLWGYRDAKDDPALEFHTKNFTPTLQSVDDFAKTLRTVQAARADSYDYPEDVFSGVEHALRQTAWTPNALRFLVLVGDAPGHELGHPRNYSGQSEKHLRVFADDHDAYLLALHIQDPRAARHHELAERQFRHLATNKGRADLVAYASVRAQDLDGFRRAAHDIAQNFVAMVAQAQQGHTAPPAPPASPPAPTPGALAAKIGHAALLEWIGRETEAKAPRDIVAWAVDKDLLNPSITALDVRILITKSQLDALKTVLSEVIAAGRRGQVSGDDFFTALQAIPSVMARLGEQVNNARAMTPLVPEFLTGLPYRSRLMALTNDTWASWSPDDQDQFLRDLEGLIRQYAAVHDTPAGWVQLNPGDDPGEAVFPLSLEALP